ncbi:MAG: FAD-dependent oxidoreductase [Desulfarculus sp.]|nr:FAD-dependent oxidoreductase [Desulfarculus sp.]
MDLQDKSVLVIGGGLAGITAALELSGQGVRVALAEKDDFLGGQAARLACKALDTCQKCNGCLAEPRLAAVLSHPLQSGNHAVKAGGVSFSGFHL